MKALLALAAVAVAAVAAGGASAASAPDGFRWGVQPQPRFWAEPDGRWGVRPDAIGRFSLIRPKARRHAAVGRW